MASLISVTNLFKTYASGFKALIDINLDIQHSEILALLQYTDRKVATTRPFSPSSPFSFHVLSNLQCLALHTLLTHRLTAVFSEALARPVIVLI